MQLLNRIKTRVGDDNLTAPSYAALESLTSDDPAIQRTLNSLRTDLHSAPSTDSLDELSDKVLTRLSAQLKAAQRHADDATAKKLHLDIKAVDRVREYLGN